MSRGPRKSELLASSLINTMNHTFASLMDIWDELGIPEEKRMLRMEEVRDCIEDLLNRMIEEEEALKERIKKSIQNSKKEMAILCEELSLGAYMLDEDLTVLQMEKDLRVKLDCLKAEKRKRLEELRQLQQEDQDLCTELFVTPYYVPTGMMPTHQQLVELKEHIRVQTEEKKKRTLIFSTLRADIRICLSEMGRQPLSGLEQDAVSVDEENLSLTSENMKALQFLKDHLKQKKDSLLSTLNILKEKVQVLWSRLQVPREDLEPYLNMSTYPLSTSIKKWETELARLDELKKASIKDIILKIREELAMYWDKCFYSAEQRNAFSPYFSDDFTEELLSEHDEELVRLKHHYEKCKDMLDAVNKWESSWEQFLVLEKKATDPNRFSNRGGSLLKEEKERMKLQKLLSKLEEELKSWIGSWEAEQGCPFLFKGRKFMDYVADQWENHKLQKDREKQVRNPKKEDNMPFKTPVKRPALSCSQGTPLNKTRKLTGTSTLASTKTTASAKTPLPTIKEAITKKSGKDSVFNSTVNENL
ncbi:protein regulator of cytokinesis 1-like isoform X2 [Pelobates fuscus]|uniref:protein regulator of cytokinesis 1-like isoform X2 n=1 Tax=Pelobates fuscus TaxID=191477 RepID=UPI002FE4F310